MKGRKDDAGKPRWDLLPWDVLKDLAIVMGKNVASHGEDNWKKVPMKDHFRATIGHLVESEAGVMEDPGDGEHPADHAACRALMYAWHKKQGVTEKAPVSANAEKLSGAKSLECEAKIKANIRME